MNPLRVHRSKSYKAWYNSLAPKTQGIVDTRIDIFISLGLLLKSKLLDPKLELYEFKWDSGLRVYYAMIEDSEGKLMLLLLGGNKNSQPRDITVAKKIIRNALSKIEEKIIRSKK